MRELTPEEKAADRVTLQKEIALGVALHNLKLNPDFRALIKEYTEIIPLNLIKEKASLVKQGLNTDNLQQQIDATAMFSLFLDTIETKRDIAMASLNELNDEE